MNAESVLLSHLRVIFGFFRRSICAALLLSIAACSPFRTIGVDFAFDVKIERIDGLGKVWRTAPDEILVLPHNPNTLSAFSNVKYSGKIFHWLVTASAANSANAGGIGARISSQLAGPVCFRFDEARLSTNWHKKPIPMLAFGQIHLPSKIYRMNKMEEPPFQPFPVCFSTQENGSFAIVPDLSALYPNKRMFNVKIADYQAVLLENGIGNWLKIHVPIEYEGKRDELEVTLTAKESKARPVWHLM